MIMAEYDDLFADEFFLIDLNDLSDVKTHLYGFVLDEKNNNIIFDENIEELHKFSPNGAYVYVEDTSNQILISQDFQGSYGLYVYQKDSNCCISNSLFKLFEYIKNKYSFSINYDYVKNSFAGHYSNFIYKETIINEITVISRYNSIKIDKKSKSIVFIKKKYLEKVVQIDSPGAIAILDGWYNKWISLIRSLKEKTNNITIDLSAGHDSRLVFGLMLNSNIDMDQITIFSANDSLSTHIVDFEFAKKLSERFDFKLNDMENSNIDKTYFNDIETSVLLSLHTHFGEYNQVLYMTSRNNNLAYNFTGYYGENIRNYPGLSKESVIELVSRASNDFRDAGKRVYDKNKKYIKEDFGDLYHDFSHTTFKEIVGATHFGKSTVNKYLINEISLNPLADYELYKIKRSNDNCKDKNLLMAVIFTRYYPELLEYKFNNNVQINKKTIDYAKKINKKYPFKKEKYHKLSAKKFKTNNITYNTPLDDSKITANLIKVFSSNSFRKSFEKYFKPEVYEFLKSNITGNNLFSLHSLYPALYFLYVMNEYEKNQTNNITSWLNYLATIPQYDEMSYGFIKKLLKYTTARIDFIAFGKDNDVEIVDCDDKDYITQRINWLDSSDQHGISVESTKTKMKLKLRCKREGILGIFLRGIYTLDKNRKTFPIYIDFTKFVVNDKNILEKPKLVSHDNYYLYNMYVNKNQIISISFEWKLFDETSNYE